MSKFLILWIFLLPVGFIHAQDSFSTPWKSVKLYANFELANSFGSTVQSPAKVVPVGFLTPAFTWCRRPRIMHEIELSMLQFNRTRLFETYRALDSIAFNYEYIGGVATTEYQLGLKYELAWKWLDWGYGAFYFGGSVEPFAAKGHFKSDQPGAYDVSEKFAGAELQGVFRLLFRLSRHWYVDLNVPAGFNLNTLDKTITQNGVRETSTGFSMDMAAGLRVGVGRRF